MLGRYLITLDGQWEKRYYLGMTVTAEIGTKSLADLIKQVQGGDEVLLTLGNKPVAKIVAAPENGIASSTALNVRSIKGHRVLTPIISQEELAEEMFGQ